MFQKLFSIKNWFLEYTSMINVKYREIIQNMTTKEFNTFILNLYMLKGFFYEKDAFI